MKQFILLFVLLLGYSIWSYGFTDPNLVLINWEPYWRFQQWAWQTFFLNRPVQTMTYVLLIASLFIMYICCIWILRKRATVLTSLKQVFLTFGAYCLVISPLFLSYNALSHDVFNYMFNARMVVTYRANPHKQVALDFAFDPWTRFMHNTHTPAPYWYGWTALSLPPYILGFGKFVITWFNFRLFAVISLLLVGLITWLWQKQKQQPLVVWHAALFFLNPLVLIEIVSNDHNDLWMIAPALLAFVLLLWRPKYTWQSLVSLVGLLLSASTKYATLILLPLWLVVYKLLLFAQPSTHHSWALAAVFAQIKKRFESVLAEQIHTYVEKLLPWLLSILLFLPLVTSRSRWFLPWYLIWSLSLLPLMADGLWQVNLRRMGIPIVDSIKKRVSVWSKRWVFWLLALSVSSMYRYVPWIWQGEYNTHITRQEILITWVGGAILFFSMCAIDQFRAKKSFN